MAKHAGASLTGAVAYTSALAVLYRSSLCVVRCVHVFLVAGCWRVTSVRPMSAQRKACGSGLTNLSHLLFCCCAECVHAQQLHWAFAALVPGPSRPWTGAASASILHEAVMHQLPVWAAPFAGAGAASSASHYSAAWQALVQACPWVTAAAGLQRW